MLKGSTRWRWRTAEHILHAGLLQVTVAAPERRIFGLRRRLSPCTRHFQSEYTAIMVVRFLVFCLFVCAVDNTFQIESLDLNPEFMRSKEFHNRHRKFYDIFKLKIISQTVVKDE